MKLSIVIITKNEEKNLPWLLESIKKQKVNFDYEIIVSDAFSDDKTREIAKEFWCKIVDGWLPAKWRNEGWKIAKWDWILFLDADVIIPIWALQIWMDKLEKSNSDIWTPFAKLKDDEKSFWADLYFRTSYFSYYFFQWAFGFCIFIKKDLFKKINWFDETIYLAEDIDFVKRAKKAWWKRKNLLPHIQTSGRRLIKTGIWKTFFYSFWWSLLLLFWIKQRKTEKNEKIYKI